ncbi:putative peptide-N(4)-(N-acetyl-beta-glucosaminyl)asparagine amidase [Rosa chinensis]|uniref:Putative peptide-N(4)-(N-acetyl-beta-glucosaminyl)asparagine amidase n=1 Tax=Rosa chinensis TaxID=74649 RepID=A0A2P6QA10_ROSCH|nr:peptide-N4-(N-acetyl-beta-glucosaminyl)asparagine amidase A [Rosa chinensis]PRQ31026.1 putative peptide-N(4)-(N-acetyl-beta-glucosaminyl)asparagine amidase [Rosa chinensis]
MATLLPLLFFLLQPLFSIANVHKLNQLRSELISQSPSLNDTPPSLDFEVTKPIPVPKTKPCSERILQHDFAYTYGKPPVFANYTPPSNCPSQKFSKIVLEWKATSKGRQFDRIFGVWLSGVELLRSCTAEPRTNGIVWSVQKDISRYYSLLQKKQTVAVYLGSLIDSTYTGVYHVNISFHFYPAEESLHIYDQNVGDLASGYHSWADLILPISRNLPLTDGLWFEVENSTDTELKEFEIPRNAYRAVLEVYVSFHENDEFWYSNPTNEYIAANNLTGTPGNGPFREVVVSLDGVLVGAVWPFTVVYTGGVNPLLWRPITGIGSFDLPSYDIEITPFLGNILDGKSHKIGFNVTNALNVWYIDANLHIWLDKQGTRTQAQLVKHTSLPLIVSVVSDFVGLNGTFVTRISRSVSSTGWVKSSNGNITTRSIQDFSYLNKMVMGNDGNLQTVDQTINFNDTVLVKTPSSYVHSLKSNKTFLLSLYADLLEQENETSLYVTNVNLGFIEKKTAIGGSRVLESSLRNLQNAEGNRVVRNNLVVSRVGNTQQVYRYRGGRFCYFRNVSSSNSTILYDEVEDTCHKKAK